MTHFLVILHFVKSSEKTAPMKSSAGYGGACMVFKKNKTFKKGSCDHKSGWYRGNCVFSQRSQS